ncbi:MAG: TIGR03905 family TSCPD domain-containing protein [Clostridia bacterium]|nr:TIGR03905 family TSCPD domain-containing protein [Clostridia bacterium]
MFTYSTNGTCSRQIVFDVTEGDNTLHNVKFIGGCSGNLQGIGKLVEGKNIDEVEKLLAGIRCRGNTSCPDQLSQAITAYKRAKAEKEKNRK